MLACVGCHCNQTGWPPHSLLLLASVTTCLLNHRQCCAWSSPYLPCAPTAGQVQAPPPSKLVTTHQLSKKPSWKNWLGTACTATMNGSPCCCCCPPLLLLLLRRSAQHHTHAELRDGKVGWRGVGGCCCLGDSTSSVPTCCCFAAASSSRCSCWQEPQQQQLGPQLRFGLCKHTTAAHLMPCDPDAVHQTPRGSACPAQTCHRRHAPPGCTSAGQLSTREGTWLGPGEQGVLAAAWPRWQGPRSLQTGLGHEGR
jgi:hypothetical protein